MYRKLEDQPFDPLINIIKQHFKTFLFCIVTMGCLLTNNSCFGLWFHWAGYDRSELRTRFEMFQERLAYQLCRCLHRWVSRWSPLSKCLFRDAWPPPLFPPGQQQVKLGITNAVENAWFMTDQLCKTHLKWFFQKPLYTPWYFKSIHIWPI